MNCVWFSYNFIFKKPEFFYQWNIKDSSPCSNTWIQQKDYKKMKTEDRSAKYYLI